MDSILTGGTCALHGTLAIQGSKNSALPIVAAALLAGDTCTIRNVPRLRDTETAAAILQALTVDVRHEARTWHITAKTVASDIPPALMQAMRSSIFFLAPMLVRTGAACIMMPGGCNLGARPIDMHLEGLHCMGVNVQQQEDRILLSVPVMLHGIDHSLRFPSVGATETLLMAAVKARGITVLRNVATEPEVVALTKFLVHCGADIRGVGTRTLRIRGGAALHGAACTVPADRVVAATVLCAVAACGGSVTLKNCAAFELSQVLHVLCRAGCSARTAKDGTLYFRAPAHLRAYNTLISGVYPALPTDVMPLLAAAFLRAKGTTHLTDTIFTARFACAEEFRRMGAQLTYTPSEMHIQGVPALQGATVAAKDLRGGAALVLAALQATGCVRITGKSHIDRGYEDIAAMFSALGANICNETIEKEQL